MTAQEYLDKHKKAHADIVGVVEFLVKIYPDLEVVTSRWDKKYYCSARVNREAVNYHTWHSCGCCEDAVLYFNPYIKHGEHTFVYGKPLNMGIGEKCSYEHKDILWWNWKDILHNFSVNEELISKFEKEFVHDSKLDEWSESCNQN